jgi:hypothetical protein
LGVCVTAIGEVTAGEAEARFLDPNHKPLALIHRSYSHF